MNVWGRGLGALIDLPGVVVVALVLWVGAGLVVLPFEHDWVGSNRDPVPVDAIPDLGENQQIVLTEWAGRSPRDIDDQISFPLSSALLGMGGVRSVRSVSMFGFSSIYVTFEEDIAFDAARARLLEKLASLPEDELPSGVAPRLGPEATALGQVFWYTLVPKAEDGSVRGGVFDPQELRSVQEFTLEPALQAVPGVAEVASVGGHLREYQIDVDPERMRHHGVSLLRIAEAVRGSNLDVGARTLEINRVEYVVRGVGFIQRLEDLEQIVVAVNGHVPVRLADVAHIGFGPGPRRGALDDAGAPAVGAVVVARHGENPRAVIRGVKARIAELASSLPVRTAPDGQLVRVTLEAFYDRSELIDQTLETLSEALLQQIWITVLVVLVMLRHLRSAIVIALVLPLSVLGAFVGMRWFGVDANLMSLAGIAIAIGTMVDMGIVITESLLTHLEGAGSRRDRIVRGLAEVAPSVVTASLTTLVTFLPVLGLEASEGKLFRPLALTKTFAVLAAVLVSLLFLPTLARWLLPEGGSAHSVRRPSTWLRPGPGRAAIALAALGVGAGLSGQGAIGVALLSFSVLRWLEPELPPRLRPWLGRLEIGVASAAAFVALASDWRPLGEGAGWLNPLFVFVAVGGGLGLASVFRGAYPWLLTRALERPFAALCLPVALVTGAALALPTLGREFMPPFDEGAFLYMPSTTAHASIGQAETMLSQLDAALASVPEADRVVGKLGRVDSALDPAPISMFETVVTYHPEFSTDEEGERVRNWRPHIRGPEDIWAELAAAADLPGLSKAPVLMPIAARLVMLQSGLRSPFAVELRGPDLESLEAAALAIEPVLREVPEVASEAVFADRLVGKPYLEIEIDRAEIARCGLTIADVQAVIQTGIGGAVVTRTVEGRERYAVRVRYDRGARASIEALGRVLVPTRTGDTVPLEQFARLRYVKGPQMIRSQDTFLTSHVLFDKRPGVAELDVVEAAGRALESARSEGRLELPTGVTWRFVGTYESQLRSEARLRLLVPLSAVLVFLLLYLQFRRVSGALLVASGVIVSASGGVLLLWLWGQPEWARLWGSELGRILDLGPVNLSVAVWVGFIALIGIATDDGVLLGSYIDGALERSRPESASAVRAAIVEAGRRRVRPCLMTTVTTVVALLPVLTSSGRGADVMRPVALPIFGGMMVELLTLFVVPILASARAQAGLHGKETKR